MSGDVWKARDVMGEVLATCWVGEMGRSAGIEGELSRNGMQLGETQGRVRRDDVPADLGPSCGGFRSGCSRVWRGAWGVGREWGVGCMRCRVFFRERRERRGRRRRRRRRRERGGEGGEKRRENRRRKQEKRRGRKRGGGGGEEEKTREEGGGGEEEEGGKKRPQVNKQRQRGSWTGCSQKH